MTNDFDFGGWATRANLHCSDGRTIMPDAFKDCDGLKVPLVWNHRHDSEERVLGHALLENRKDGVYAYCKFNNTEQGRNAKELVQHGDITALSIYANRLQENGKKVMHGIIREVSLVLAGANPGAYIDSVIMHADGSTGEDRDQGIIYTNEELVLYHADEDEDEDEDISEETKEDKEVADLDLKKGETIGDVYNTLTDKQKLAVYAMISQIIEGGNNTNNNDEEDTNVKHNLFDSETDTQNTLTHSEMTDILNQAKSPNCGSLQSALKAFADDNGAKVVHADADADFYETLFPEYKDLRPGAPEIVRQDQGWVSTILNGAHKSPMSRVRTRQTDIRDITELRARGYKKGAQKTLRGDPKLVHRTTDPQTVYVKSTLNRDDVVDITDFDVVEYMYGIDRTNLNEELARAITIGDGRDSSDAQKISAEHIRPIWTDDELYTIHTDVDIAGMKTKLQGTNTSANFGENFVEAEAIIQALLYARENYRGSGKAVFICTPHLVNVMLLARDITGRRVYNTVEDIKAALNVKSVVTSEMFENQVRQTSDSKKKKLLGLFVDMSDYNIGSTKGGELTRFSDFDINFNQHQSLLETRLSGALTRIQSAIALEEDVTDDSSATVTTSEIVA